METIARHVIKLWTTFQKNLIVGCQYKRNMVLKKRGHIVPPGHRREKSLAWIGLRFSRYAQEDSVNLFHLNC